MKKKQIKFLKSLLETPSPTGSEIPVADLVRERLLPFADEIRTDTMGSVHATLEGALHSQITQIEFAADEFDVSIDTPDGIDQDSVSSFAEMHRAAASAIEPEDEVPPMTLMLAAHMDEVGLMVTYISDDGYLSVSSIGGVDAAILPGMRVDVHAASGTLRGVVGRKPIHLIDADDRKSVTPLDKLVIDLGLPAKVVKETVKVGDSITYGVGFERLGKGMAVSRAFDDKVGVFIACRVMENLSQIPAYKGNFVTAITVQEEIGTRGAMTSAHSIWPDVAIAFDVTHATDYPGIDKTKYGKIVCGDGPVIARGPNINPVVFERLVRAAEEEGIKYQLEAEPSVTGTDARAIQVTRGGIPTGLVSVPLRYMHTPTEVLCLKDVENTIRLLTRFALDLDLDGNVRFIPGYVRDYESPERIRSIYGEDTEIVEFTAADFKPQTASEPVEFAEDVDDLVLFGDEETSEGPEEAFDASVVEDDASDIDALSAFNMADDEDDAMPDLDPANSIDFASLDDDDDEDIVFSVPDDSEDFAFSIEEDIDDSAPAVEEDNAVDDGEDDALQDEEDADDRIILTVASDNAYDAYEPQSENEAVEIQQAVSAEESMIGRSVFGAGDDDDPFEGMFSPFDYDVEPASEADDDDDDDIDDSLEYEDFDDDEESLYFRGKNARHPRFENVPDEPEIDDEVYVASEPEPEPETEPADGDEPASGTLELKKKPKGKRAKKAKKSQNNKRLRQEAERQSNSNYYDYDSGFDAGMPSFTISLDSDDDDDQGPGAVPIVTVSTGN